MDDKPITSPRRSDTPEDGTDANETDVRKSHRQNNHPEHWRKRSQSKNKVELARIFAEVPISISPKPPMSSTSRT
jgi:hypothetical protein